MADKPIVMNPAKVKDIAETFSEVSDVLTNVSQVMQGLIDLLEGTAFVGLVGGLALAQFMESVKPYIDKMASTCSDLNQEVLKRVQAYENEDLEVANLWRH